jgi:hypothetical protein
MRPRALLLAELSLLGIEHERPLVIGALKFSKGTTRPELDELAAELRKEAQYTHIMIHGRARGQIERVLGFSYEVAPFYDLKVFFETFEEELIGSLRERFGERLVEWEMVGAMHVMRPVIRSLSPRQTKKSSKPPLPKRKGKRGAKRSAARG